MKMPLISVIIPVYNTKEYLPQCLDSFLDQKYKDFEMVLVDDGSTDGSGRLCDEYASKFDNVKVIHKKNEGVSVARNTGIEESVGDYLLFVDSDDFVAKNSLVRIASTLEKNRPDFCFLNAYKYFRDGKKQVLDRGYDKGILLKGDKEEILRHISGLNKFPGAFWSKAISAEFMKKNKLFFPEGQAVGEDISLVIKALIAADKFDYCEGEYYYYRQQRKGSASNTQSVEKFNDIVCGLIGGWIEYCKYNPIYSKYIYSFLCYEYCIAIAGYGKLSKKNKTKYKSYMKDISWLFKYRKDRKTRCVLYCYRVFGLEMTAKLLQIYLKIR